jgi:hypothetical protein
MPDVLIQVIAIKINSRLMYDYPEKSEIVKKYKTCKRFWEPHREIKTASMNKYHGRFLLGDFVTYQLGNQISLESDFYF